MTSGPSRYRTRHSGRPSQWGTVISIVGRRPIASRMSAPTHRQVRFRDSGRRESKPIDRETGGPNVGLLPDALTCINRPPANGQNESRPIGRPSEAMTQLQSTHDARARCSGAHGPGDCAGDAFQHRLGCRYSAPGVAGKIPLHDCHEKIDAAAGPAWVDIATHYLGNNGPTRSSPTRSGRVPSAAARGNGGNGSLQGRCRSDGRYISPTTINRGYARRHTISSFGPAEGTGIRKEHDRIRAMTANTRLRAILSKRP